MSTERDKLPQTGHFGEMRGAGPVRFSAATLPGCSAVAWDRDCFASPPRRRPPGCRSSPGARRAAADALDGVSLDLRAQLAVAASVYRPPVAAPALDPESASFSPTAAAESLETVQDGVYGGDGAEFFKAAERMGLEGIVSKTRAVALLPSGDELLASSGCS